MSQFLISTLAFIFALGVIIFIHELGHLLLAKLFDTRVKTFSLGFGKRLFGFERGETDYRVSLIPLGGYVALGGENPEEATGDPREFLSKPRWQRIVVYLAGPAMNVVLSVALIAATVWVGCRRVSGMVLALANVGACLVVTLGLMGATGSPVYLTTAILPVLLTTIGLAAIGVTIGTALVIDFEAFWSAAVEFHTTTLPRSDSSNFVGLLSSLGIDWAPTTLVSLAVGLVVAFVFGRRSRTRSSFMFAVALTLAASFLVSSQAFANYWFLVTGLCVVSLARSNETVVPGTV